VHDGVIAFPEKLRFLTLECSKMGCIHAKEAQFLPLKDDYMQILLVIFYSADTNAYMVLLNSISILPGTGVPVCQ
jgi:hypothetical protein